MNPHHRAILQRIQAAPPGRGQTSQRPEHLGTARHWYGLTNAQRRRILQDFARDHRSLPYKDWRDLIDALYHGESYEERCAPQTLFLKYPVHRRALPLSQLAAWLGCLDGWAEVDSTCQTVFPAKDLLADWSGWSAFLHALAADANVNKRRAALVLLTAPVTQSDDPRLLNLSLDLIGKLQSDRDKRITKAVSWLLRKAIKHHRAAIAKYVEAHAGTLPAIAIRETRRKLLTGKK